MPGQAVSAAPFGGAADSTREREAGARPPGDAESAAVADAAAPAEVLNLGYCPSRRAQSASLLLVVRGNGFHQPCSLSLGAAMAARPVRLLIREHIVFGSQAALFCTCVDGYGRSGNRGSNFAQGWREPRGTKRHHLASESVQFHARLASASALLRSEAPLARSSFKRSHGAWAVCRPPFQHEVTSVPTGLPVYEACSSLCAPWGRSDISRQIHPQSGSGTSPPLFPADWPSAVPRPAILHATGVRGPNRTRAPWRSVTGLAQQPRVVVPSPSEGSSVAMSQESIAAPTAARYAAFSHGVYGCLPTLRIRRRAAGDLLDLADRGRA